jgi:hypothetical protein
MPGSRNEREDLRSRIRRRRPRAGLAVRQAVLDRVVEALREQAQAMFTSGPRPRGRRASAGTRRRAPGRCPQSARGRARRARSQAASGSRLARSAGAHPPFAATSATQSDERSRRDRGGGGPRRGARRPVERPISSRLRRGLAGRSSRPASSRVSSAWMIRPSASLCALVVLKPRAPSTRSPPRRPRSSIGEQLGAHLASLGWG